MPVYREQMEENEAATLSPFAQYTAASAGRHHPEPDHPYRTTFQRDRSRIIHSKAFRRLEYKTQVFLNGTGDHLRTRLTHTIEVASVSRTIACALGANEDLAETIAIKNVFGDHAYKLSVSSTKSALGHSLGASGGIELILSIMGIQDQVAPPTINLEIPDPECDLDYTPLTPKQRPIKIAMSNSFGFGGHNASIVIQAFR